MSQDAKTFAVSLAATENFSIEGSLGGMSSFKYRYRILPEQELSFEGCVPHTDILGEKDGVKELELCVRCKSGEVIAIKALQSTYMDTNRKAQPRVEGIPTDIRYVGNREGTGEQMVEDINKYLTDWCSALSKLTLTPAKTLKEDEYLVFSMENWKENPDKRESWWVKPEKTYQLYALK